LQAEMKSAGQKILQNLFPAWQTCKINCVFHHPVLHQHPAHQRPVPLQEHQTWEIQELQWEAQQELQALLTGRIKVTMEKKKPSQNWSTAFFFL